MTRRIVLSELWTNPQPERQGTFAPFYPGVSILPLYGMSPQGSADSPAEPAAAFIRYEPGAAVPAHHHHGYEHIFVLQGAQADDHGEYVAGSCLISPPGTAHRITSERGCLVLALWNRPVEVRHD